MPSNRKKGVIHGQAKPVDSATGTLWENVDHFSEVFNKAVFKRTVIYPYELDEANQVEEVILRVRGTDHITLKNTRDVTKSLKSLPDGRLLMILGIENSSEVIYQMPFKVMELDFINYARQIANIEQKNTAEFKEEIVHPSSGEYIGRFKKTDRIKPAITLVIYYGKDIWDGPRSLKEMFDDCVGKDAARDYEMYLIDARHMSPDELNSYSPALKAFFGFLTYEHTDELGRFVEENTDSFSDLPTQTIDALIEITHSKELEIFKRDYRTPEGGVNVCYGIQEVGKRNFIEAAQIFGQTIAVTIAAFAAKFHVSQEEAEKAVKKYWK